MLLRNILGVPGAFVQARIHEMSDGAPVLHRRGRDRAGRGTGGVIAGAIGAPAMG
jgi:hypothetical protein